MNVSKNWITGVSVLMVMTLLAGSAWAGSPDKAGSGPLKVFILAGQSNMQGYGKIKMDPKRNGGKGTLEYAVKAPATAGRMKHVVGADGKFVVRKDVWICCDKRQGGLSAGYGVKSTMIGPEFAFGHALGEAMGEQVLIIKTAWGGKSLQKDFRPPSSGGTVGPYYTQMLKIIRDILGDIKKHYPAYDGKGYEIAGFGWHQGWNDGCSDAAVAEYEKNMANFIRDVRKALDVKKLPFVIADSGFGGAKQRRKRRLVLREAQYNVSQHDEFKGNVITIRTGKLSPSAKESPGRGDYHWYGNAWTYFQIGEAMGAEMLKMIGVKASNIKAAVLTRTPALLERRAKSKVH
ncbi:MAG: sialate O-acetylesterase [Phycisphaerales bacterium]|jgi:hypothetical protein|nr:sialate O-acetylesterase [Phycisphaerales bacterium]